MQDTGSSGGYGSTVEKLSLTNHYKIYHLTKKKKTALQAFTFCANCSLKFILSVSNGLLIGIAVKLNLIYIIKKIRKKKTNTIHLKFYF